jgi:hypothetical protein
VAGHCCSNASCSAASSPPRSPVPTTSTLSSRDRPRHPPVRNALAQRTVTAPPAENAPAHPTSPAKERGRKYGGYRARGWIPPVQLSQRQAARRAATTTIGCHSHNAAQVQASHPPPIGRSRPSVKGPAPSPCHAPQPTIGGDGSEARLPPRRRPCCSSSSRRRRGRHLDGVCPQPATTVPSGRQPPMDNRSNAVDCQSNRPRLSGQRPTSRRPARQPTTVSCAVTAGHLSPCLTVERSTRTRRQPTASHRPPRHCLHWRRPGNDPLPTVESATPPPGRTAIAVASHGAIGLHRDRHHVVVDRSLHGIARYPIGAVSDLARSRRTCPRIPALARTAGSQPVAAVRSTHPSRPATARFSRICRLPRGDQGTPSPPPPGHTPSARLTDLALMPSGAVNASTAPPPRFTRSDGHSLGVQAMDRGVRQVVQAPRAGK